VVNGTHVVQGMPSQRVGQDHPASRTKAAAVEEVGFRATVGMIEIEQISRYFLFRYYDVLGVG
jgi:hypothetical protein